MEKIDKETIRIDYDDQLMDVVEGLSSLIEPYQMKFEEDDESHDGFNYVKLVKTK